jgi:predicted phosphodiesterase
VGAVLGPRARRGFRLTISSARHLPRVARVFGLPLVVGAAGALLAVAVLGRHDARIGPATVRLAARPAPSGSSRLVVPPFGSVTARTHRGPVTFQATLTNIDVEALGRMLNGGRPGDAPPRGNLSRTLAPLEVQARAAAKVLVLKVVGSGLAGGAAATVLFRRRSRRRWLLCLAGGTLATATLLGPAMASYNLAAFRAPRYHGALEYAPALIGDAETGVQRLRTLRQQMALISENLDRAYAALGSPVPTLDGDIVRILHVSDIHLNPVGFDLAERLATQFDVAAVVDTGDMGTWGLPAEADVPARIAEFKVPYLFVKGNHDNGAIVRAVAANRQAHVLDQRTFAVRGIRFYGVADPTFSPGKGYRIDQMERLKAVRGVDVAGQLDRLQPPADVLLVHDPMLASSAAGRVATVLDGHLHAFGTSLDHGTRFLTTGTVGAAGPDGLRATTPPPYSAEVVYFSASTHRPVAVDRISVPSLGKSFSVERTVLEEGNSAFVPDPVDLPESSTLPPGGSIELPRGRRVVFKG